MKDIGILSGIEPTDTRHEAMRERIMALVIASDLDRREREMVRNAVFLTSDRLAATRFERRLLSYAVERGITLLNADDWRIPALLSAAAEHPQLSSSKPKRGRPASVGGIGLLGSAAGKGRQHKNAEQYASLVRDIIARDGVSQRQACHILAAALYPSYAQQGLESKAKQIENHVSRFNNSRGERRLSGRPRSAKT